MNDGGVLTQSTAGGVDLVIPTKLVASIKEAAAKIPTRENDLQQLETALDTNSPLAGSWVDNLCMRTYRPEVILKLLNEEHGAEALKNAAQAQLDLIDLGLELRRIIHEWTTCAYGFDG